MYLLLFIDKYVFIYFLVKINMYLLINM